MHDGRTFLLNFYSSFVIWDENDYYKLFTHFRYFHFDSIFSCFEDCYWYCIEERFCFDKNIGEWESGGDNRWTMERDKNVETFFLQQITIPMKMST